MPPAKDSPYPYIPHGWWLALSAIGGLASSTVAALTLMWFMFSPPKQDYVMRAEYIEVIKRLDGSLSDLKSSNSVMQAQIQDIWQKYYRDREPSQSEIHGRK